VEHRAEADAARSELMRALLHHPGFQGLEAAWRGVHFLARRLETNALLKLELFDVSRAEVAAETQGVFQLLERSSTGGPWALVVGHYTFGPERPDLELLASLGAIGQRLGTPWLAGADPHLIGGGSVPERPDPDDRTAQTEAAWRELRRRPQARWLGLTLPRFLLRLPYGRETDPCESFAFEEMAGQPEHGRYLWGNPALACACLLAESFLADGWDLRPGGRLNLGSLPLHIYKREGEPFAQPCAEVLLTEREAASLLESGIMPLASLKDSDEVRLVRFQSIADPPAPLAGRWAS
jgi:type VI secretion system protein ImpC